MILIKFVYKFRFTRNTNKKTFLIIMNLSELVKQLSIFKSNNFI